MAGSDHRPFRGHGGALAALGVGVIDTYLAVRPGDVTRAPGADIEALAVRYGIEPVGRPVGVYRVTGSQEAQP